MSINVYLNRFPVDAPWGGGNMFVKAFHKFAAGDDVVLVPPDKIDVPCDIILLAGLDGSQSGISAEQAIMYKLYMSGKRDVKLVLRVNENDARKSTNGVDKAWIAASGHVDGTIFVSDWLQDYFYDLGWKNNNSCVVKNGVDHEIFKPNEKLNNGMLNIVAHHWSNNEMKGFDVYEQIDQFVGENSDKYTFTYIGRDRRTFKNTNVIKPLFMKSLAEELGKYDVYVSASRFDPGPNHVLEAIACGMPTFVHKNGGGGVEFAGPSAVYGSWNQLKDRLVNRDFPTNHPQISDWETCIKEYMKFMRSL